MSEHNCENTMMNLQRRFPAIWAHITGDYGPGKRRISRGESLDLADAELEALFDFAERIVTALVKLSKGTTAQFEVEAFLYEGGGDE